jgi:hypothetical protein
MKLSMTGAFSDAEKATDPGLSRKITKKCSAFYLLGDDIIGGSEVDPFLFSCVYSECNTSLYNSLRPHINDVWYSCSNDVYTSIKGYF